MARAILLSTMSPKQKLSTMALEAMLGRLLVQKRSDICVVAQAECSAKFRVCEDHTIYPRLSSYLL